MKNKVFSKNLHFGDGRFINSIEIISSDFRIPLLQTPHVSSECGKDYLSLAKCRKRTAKKIWKAIKKQLQYVKRALGYIDLFLAQDDVYLKPKQMERLNVLRELAE